MYYWEPLNGHCLMPVPQKEHGDIWSLPFPKGVCLTSWPPLQLVTPAFLSSTLLTWTWYFASKNTYLVLHVILPSPSSKFWSPEVQDQDGGRSSYWWGPDSWCKDGTFSLCPHGKTAERKKTLCVSPHKDPDSLMRISLHDLVLSQRSYFTNIQSIIALSAL